MLKGKRSIWSFIIGAIFLFPVTAFSQTGPVDWIESIVGEDLILRSDLEAQYQYMVQNGEKDDGTLLCRLLERALVEKLLLNKARQDSLVVSDDQVEQELERRISIFINMYGSVEEIEKVYGKPLIELKTSLRPEIRDQLLVEQMRGKIFEKASVTPRDVKKFFNEIPKDSLPYMPAEVEVNQIIIFPEANAEEKERTKAKLNEYRSEILAKRTTFEKVAREVSDDLGSAKLGGTLPEFGRGMMVTEFEEMAFSMNVGDVSPVFETQFGYHIIWLKNRVGEKVTASHILIKPTITSKDDSLVMKRLKMIRAAIVSDSISFEMAALEWSQEKQSASCGGCIRNPQNGELRVPLDALDADMFLKVDKMKKGDISQPAIVRLESGEYGYQLLFLKNKLPAHVANLNDDYLRIKEAALQAKQLEVLGEWLESARKNVSVEIKNSECRELLSNWEK